MAWEYEARHMIEALRSGVPSRAIGRHFSEAREDLLSSIEDGLDRVIESEASEAFIISGKYGEGKTHLLNTVWELADQRNMVVSMVSISKETPLDKLHVLYPKLVANTYLPNHTQPGFTQELSKLSANSALMQHLLLYTQNQLETNRLYYHLSCLVRSDDPEEQYLLETDLMGDFIPNHQINKIHRRIFGEKASFNKPFAKTKHALDYYRFLSHLFVKLGYSGWVILFDESELIGRYGKKARQKTYLAMDNFLNPSKSLK
ncbi:MAG: BREX system ATP-binding domain-containing protein, partial [Sphaerochaeta sp.]